MPQGDSPAQTTATTYVIPDFIAVQPSPKRVNQHYASTVQVSMDWLDSFGVHPNVKHRKAFQSMDFGMLTAICYADADAERFRLLCDFINVLFAYDDLADEGALRLDGDGARKAADIIMEVLYDTDRETPFKCGRVFASLWSRVLESGISTGAARRFLESTDSYLQAVAQHVVNRSANHILGIDDFLQLRRENGALKMCFAMGEFGQGLDIPDEVLAHPLIKIMEDASNDVVVLSNDIYSYNIEQAQGDTQSIIETAMKEKKCSLQAAFDFAGKLVTDRIELFAESKRQLPSWGPAIDDQLKQYIVVLEDWMTGGFNWSLRSDRYFGNDVEEVKRTRVVRLLPKQAPRGEHIIPGLPLPSDAAHSTESPSPAKSVAKLSSSGKLRSPALLLWGYTMATSVLEWLLSFVP